MQDARAGGSENASKKGMPVLPETMHSRAHEIIHGVIGGRNAAEYLTNTLSLLVFSHFLVPCTSIDAKKSPIATKR
jgi:hypothetical protein